MTREEERRAALIAVGTELVAEGRPDTNGAAIARMLAAAGIETAARILVPDDEEEIARALGEMSARFPLVILTGGLGPTVDDVTREAVSRAFGLPLEVDPAALESIRARYRRLGRDLSEPSARQAMVPRGASVLPNECGTAPGLLLARPGGRIVALLPGVPHEMEHMMKQQLLPRLMGSDAALPARPLVSRALKTGGLTEVEVQRRIQDLFGGAGAEAPRLTLLASPGEIGVVIRGRDASRVGRLFEEIRARLAENVFALDLETGLESAVGALLVSRGLRLATAESCTGGLLGWLVSRVPGSSGWYLQGWVTYANEAKVTMLGIDAALIQAHGAVSPEVADAMACAARRLSGADIALSITGIAGPEGGTPEKPVGLVYVSLAGRSGARASQHLFAGDREAIRLFAARAALDRARREVAAWG